MVEVQTITTSGTGPVRVDTYAWHPSERSIFSPPEDDCDLILNQDFTKQGITIKINKKSYAKKRIQTNKRT
uniref:Uncharacterized protein n=1 Tax=Dictyoglomus turgidum TaxID=513050 RepID=A0A7C3SNB4_9BACT